MRCPTCEAPLIEERVTAEIRRQLNMIARWPDEQVYRCPNCDGLFLEEDFYYTEE